MTLKLSGKLQGNVYAQPSKSAAHRALICAGLSQGTSVIENIEQSKDIEATARCLEAIGVCDVEFFGNTAHVRGGKPAKEYPILDCGESGSTYRFMLPISAALCKHTKFVGAPRLFERPITPLTDELAAHGAIFENNSISGGLIGGEYKVAGNVSSQYITGLLFALPLLGQKSSIKLTTPLESAGYVDMTIDMQKKFGVKNTFSEGVYSIHNAKYKACDVRVEGDYSHAAFFAVAGAIGEGVAIEGLNGKSLQGDKEILRILDDMGAKIEIRANRVTVFPGNLTATDIDAKDIPDLVPVLAVAACAAKGKTTIYNAERLRIKESDRLQTISEGLNQIGADVTVSEDGLVINGTKLTGGHASSAGDHRIAMSLAVASALCKNPVVLEGAEHVSKSAPQFWDEFKSLGGIVIE